MLRFTTNIIGQMTRHCNLKCTYCYENNKEFTDVPSMDFETFKEVFCTVLYHRCILGNKNNPLIWHFHGGEVLTIPWEDLKKSISYVEKMSETFPNIDWCIQTNGTLLTDEIAEWFALRKKPIGFSFDGFEVTDRLSSEKKNRELISKLKSYHDKYGTTFEYLSVLSKKNLKTWVKDWYEMSSFCDSVGINVLCDTDDTLIPTPEEQWEYWIKPVLDSYLEGNPIPERDCRIAIAGFFEEYLFTTRNIFKTGCFNRLCGFGSNMIAINNKMEVTGCDKYLDRGNYSNLIKKEHLKDRDFLGMRNVSYTLNHYRELFKAEKEVGCDSCPARYICVGNCQSYSISRFGKVTLDKGMCNIYKKLYDYLCNNWIDILLNNEITLEINPTSIQSHALKQLDERNVELVFNTEKRSVKCIQKEIIQ